MNFQHVKTFCAIVSEGTFSRAAEKLHLAQPTVSAQVQALEKELGAKLFERSAQGSTITHAGRLFHQYALQMLELAERAEEALDQLRTLRLGRLEVGASSVPGHYILPAALARFKATHPGVEVRLSVSNSREVREGVREGRFEIGMVGDEVPDPRLTYAPLVQDRLVVALRPEHPLAQRPCLSLHELFQQPVILREEGSGTRATLDRALRSADLHPHDLRVLLELGTLEGVKAALREVDALAIVSEWSVREDARLGLLVTLPLAGVDLTRHLYLIQRAYGFLSVASETFVRLLQEQWLDAPPPRVGGASLPCKTGESVRR
jgi:DNA-binding transcriptional LysR family regulator